MSGRAWASAAVLLLGLLLALWWLLIRPLSDEEQLIRLARDYVSQESDYQLDVSGADWSIFSPFGIRLHEVKLTGPEMPHSVLAMASLKLNFRISSLLSLDQGLQVTSVGFRDARLVSTSPYGREEEGLGTGLRGQVRIETSEQKQRIWQLELEAEDMQAQPILTYLGTGFEMQSRIDLEGAFTASGSDLDALRDSLSGEIILSGGPGRLDLRDIGSLNRGPVRWARDSGHFVDWPDLMDFQRLDARFEVLQGLDDTSFTFTFENLSLNGFGAIDFFDSKIDYQFELQISSRGEQETFRAGEYVADTPWPIRCVGSFEERLPCGLDQDALAELAIRLIERDAKDRLSRTFGEILQELAEEDRD